MSATHSTYENASFDNQTQVGNMIVVKAADGIHNVANYEHGSEVVTDHTYTVSALDGCTCPAAKYHDGLCKHEEAVLDAKIEIDGSEDDPSITGPHTGFDAYGNADHQYYRCEECGLESTDDVMRNSCFRCNNNS